MLSSRLLPGLAVCRKQVAGEEREAGRQEASLPGLQGLSVVSGLPMRGMPGLGDKGHGWRNERLPAAGAEKDRRSPWIISKRVPDVRWGL